MSTDEIKQIVKNNLLLATKAIFRLKQSTEKSPNCEQKEYTDAEWETIDALTSRYGRASDILFNKVFRSIDELELYNGGTLLDVANRCEKRGIIENVNQMRALKDIRNEIAHEYAEEDMIEFYKEVLEATNQLFKIFDQTEAYLNAHHAIVLD